MKLTEKLNGTEYVSAILRKVTDYGDTRAKLAQAWELRDIEGLIVLQREILGDIGAMLTARGVPSPDLEARLDAAFASGELDHRPVPAERIVMTYRDRQGDYWDRRPNGLFHLRYHNGDPSKGYTGTGVAEAELTDPRDTYAPMTAVAWAQNAESAAPSAPGAPALPGEPSGLVDIERMGVSREAKAALRLAYNLNKGYAKPGPAADALIKENLFYLGARRVDDRGIAEADMVGKATVEFNDNTEQWSVIFR